jgi:hypothetical protein
MTERSNAYKALIGKSKERRDLLEDLDIERILLRWNFKKYYKGVRTRFM